MSGGDGMGGLVLAIALAALLMFAACTVAGFLIVGLLTRSKPNNSSRALLQFCGAAAGAILGSLWVVATFAESTWTPPDELTLRLPSNFAHSSIYLIEQNDSTTTLTWSGSNHIPFMKRTATIEVPSTGVVRVKSLGMGEVIALPRVFFSDREEANAGFSRQAPKEIGSGLMFGFSRAASTDEYFSGDDISLVNEVRKREGQ